MRIKPRRLVLRLLHFNRHPVRRPAPCATPPPPAPTAPAHAAEPGAPAPHAHRSRPSPRASPINMSSAQALLIHHRRPYPACWPHPAPRACRSVVAAARIDVSGVRNSWVSESISAVRSRSPSRAASIRAVASIASGARQHNRHLRAHRRATSCDKHPGRQPNAPTGRSPSINGIALKPPGIAWSDSVPASSPAGWPAMLMGNSAVEA